MTSVLTLSTYAMLVEFNDRSIHMYFEGQNFGAGDKVPPQIAGWEESYTYPFNAGAYVMMCMVEKYGPDPREWPALGRRFLYPDEGNGRRFVR